MIKIGLVGTPGAGKTTTARALAGFARNHTDIKTVELVAEYARVYVHQYGISGVEDQFRILGKQIDEEDKFPQTIDLLITDSPIFLGYAYALELRKEGNNKDTMWLNDIFVKMNKLNQVPRYDIIFHLPPVLTPVNDGIRLANHFDKEWREKADLRIQGVFQIFPPRKFVTLSSLNIEDRVKEAAKHINDYLGNTIESCDFKK